MKRPSFQFYPADWKGNTNLSRCTHHEKGIWLEVMLCMHDSDEYGILRWPLADIATAVRCDIEDLHSLIRKGILKGSDKDIEKVSFSTKISIRNNDSVVITLINEEPGPLWYSSRMVRDEYIRKKRGEHGEKSTKNPNVPRRKRENDLEKDTFSTVEKSAEKDTFSPSPTSTSTSTSSTTDIKKKDNTNVLSKKEKKRMISFPENFEPKYSHLEFCAGRNLNLANQLEAFRDYHLSKANRFADWDRAFFTWLRKAAEFKNNSLPSRSKESAADMNWRLNTSGLGK